MSDLNQSSNEHTSQQQLKVFIYVDYQNARLDIETAKLLLEFAKSKGDLISIKVYYNSHCKDQSAAMDYLDSIGCKCIDVPCSLKNSADNQLMADYLEDIDSNVSPDIVILVSGDGDFVKLVNNGQKLGKIFIIFSQIGQVKQKLKERADEFYFIDDLPKLVGGKTQPQTTVNEMQISYNEAVGYLIEAITTALKLGKRTGLGYINTLMRQLFPKYQGVFSISTPDGKKFKSFGKFVDSAINLGRIQRQNQELRLIE
ncbi:NYN domain-containing protein [Cylindrospermum sp. FACHB-282]|uniref:NYN domain-containing protein n=1 Tax=Cylindrospermum sp. FACHB-282 TaxID=2692794 RepID=UPI001687A695|nr:NYN domain-containing protein [Cylindrospermum sp. FACHB-282]MBD2387706.1 NYN domain-containing protein [Cylindrospermum sp. FACHB-282]